MLFILFLRLIIDMTQADAEADDDLKLIIFGSEHRCQDLKVSPYCVSKALTFRAAQGCTVQRKGRSFLEVFQFQTEEESVL